MAEAAPATKKPSSWRILGQALRDRKTGFMLLFGFASGLPFALFLGTLFAWLTEAEVDLETMGVFSLIGLAYAFQFIWSPLIDKVSVPGLRRLGRRKQWIIPMQLLLGAILVTMAMLDPRSALGMFSLLAGVGALASATQDIAINAWRIDVADEKATLDVLSTVYQMGFRLASLAGGALALIIAERIGWPQTYMLMGALLLAIGIAGLFAPDGTSAAGDAASIESDAEVRALRNAGSLSPRVRNRALAIVGVLWAGAIAVLLNFMIRSLTAVPEDRPDPTEFTLNWGPWVIVATIVIPALVAGWLAGQQRKGHNVLTEDAPPAHGLSFALDHLYRALVLPLVEFVGRMGWSLVLILALVLTYRICDAIWGTFAYPFYLGELQYTKDEVAFASKIFGVGAIVLGLAIGGWMLTAVGRMPTLLIGGLLAALTNLLYADMAAGGRVIGAVAESTGFAAFVSGFPGGSEKLARLMLTIGGENLAIGIAGAAFVAWLSSIVSKQFSAVQYALLSSLTLLVGTLGRGALGQMIERQGFYDVFVLTMWIGVAAMALVVAEWWRQRRTAAAGVISPDPSL
jgi:MFS transporter, PAT family, beta-lactamase induction signal transducer AmpG